MMTFSVCNRKGGVGKTTTAFNLAAGLAEVGKTVLAIDLDGQCNLTRMMGLEPQQPSSFGLLTGEADVMHTIQGTSMSGNLHLIPANPMLTTTDRVLPPGFSRNMMLRKALRPLENEYDYCIIDTPPAIGAVTINALVTSDFVIIPAEANELSMDGIIAVYESVTDVKENVNPTLEISGILLTRYKSRTTLAKEYRHMLKETADRLNTIVYEQPIRESVALAELPSVHQSIFKYKGKSAAAEDYGALVSEVIGISEMKQSLLDDKLEEIRQEKGYIPKDIDVKKLDY